MVNGTEGTGKNVKKIREKWDGGNRGRKRKDEGKIRQREQGKKERMSEG